MFIPQTKGAEIDYLNDISVANGYQLFMVEQQDIHFLCLNLQQQESIERRLEIRTQECVKPESVEFVEQILGTTFQSFVKREFEPQNVQSASSSKEVQFGVQGQGSSN